MYPKWQRNKATRKQMDSILAVNSRKAVDHSWKLARKRSVARKRRHHQSMIYKSKSCKACHHRNTHSHSHEVSICHWVMLITANCNLNSVTAPASGIHMRLQCCAGRMKRQSCTTAAAVECKPPHSKISSTNLEHAHSSWGCIPCYLQVRNGETPLVTAEHTSRGHQSRCPYCKSL